MFYKCGCGYEADHEERIRQHLQDEHLDMCQEYLDDYIEDIVEEMFLRHVTIVDSGTA